MIPIAKIIVTAADIKSVVDVLKSGHLVQGAKVAILEKNFAELCKTKYAVALNSGTAALHTTLYACGVEAGDEVITTPFTFVATANAILMVGAKPIFVDIDEKTFNIDPAKIEAAVTKKTKAIIAVNMYGQPADYDAINAIAKKYHLFVIEDAAQSVNASYKKKKSGNLSNAGCFSLYASKNIMSAEGGIITTNDKRIYEKAKLFRHHGQSEKKGYDYADLGFNYRMTDILATLAISQLNKVENITRKRQKNARFYDRALQKMREVRLPLIQNNRTHVYHQYTLRIKQNAKMNRNELKIYLEKKGIQTNIYYPIPLYRFQHLSISGAVPAQFPVTEKVVKEVLSIPIHPYLNKEELDYITDTIIHTYHV